MTMLHTYDSFVFFEVSIWHWEAGTIDEFGEIAKIISMIICNPITHFSKSYYKIAYLIV